GIRIDETDAQPPAVINPVDFADGAAAAAGTLVFDLIQPTTAQPVAAFGSDFYAGMPAVTRNQVGDGQAWYVGSVLDADGVDRVVRRALDRHDLVGPYADDEGVELAIRGDGDRAVHFVLNHAAQPRRIRAHVGGTDLLTGRSITRAEAIDLAPTDILILR